MEDQRKQDITLNPPEIPQKESMQDFPSSLILPGKNQNISRWSELPPIVLEKIYSYLDRKDRNQMSLVCRKWCQEYSAPSLWRTMKIFFPQTLHSGNVCQAVRYAEKYGYAFHHVEINCKVIEFSSLVLMGKQLGEFLETLTCFSQLSSVSFVNMFRYCAYRPVDAFQDICHRITLFLLSQNNIGSIRFHNCNFQNFEALEILRGIFNERRRNLKHLVLEGFSEELPLNDFNVIDVPSTHNILMSLQKIEVDYSPIFENLITSCFEYGNSTELPNKIGMLQEIKITYSHTEMDDFRGISAEAWKYFSKKFPSLRINLLYFDESDSENRFQTLIVQYMPLKILHFASFLNSEVHDETTLGHLLSQLVLCEVTEFLEDVHIMWHRNAGVFASDLINFLQTCTRLLNVHLHIKHPAQGLDVVFNNLLNYSPPSVEAISLTIANIPTEQERSYYLDIVQYFTPLLLVKNFKLFLWTLMKDN